MSQVSRKEPERISVDLRGNNAYIFEAFRKELSAELGFHVTASMAVLWAIKQATQKADSEEVEKDV